MKKRVTICLTEKEIRDLKKHADMMELTFSDLVRRIFDNWLLNNEIKEEK